MKKFIKISFLSKLIKDQLICERGDEEGGAVKLKKEYVCVLFYCDIVPFL